MTTPIVRAAEELCSAIEGVDWDAARVNAAIAAVHQANEGASPAQRDAAVERIAARVLGSAVDEADGVAYAAITGGALVEHGASPRVLGEALLARLPSVLRAARGFADRCLADPSAKDETERDPATIVAYVDGVAITRELLRRHLTADRPGGAALARLREWVLPSVATWSRDRPLLARAQADAALRDAARAMADSEASWISTLLATELDAPWRLVLALGPAGAATPRVFDLQVDAVSANFDLQAQVEAALAARGLGVPDPFRFGRFVSASLELFAWSGITLVRPDGRPSALPMNEVVWREGTPRDVPFFEGVRTLVATTAAMDRTWNPGRAFHALEPRVTVTREWPADEAAALVTRMRAAADARTTGSPEKTEGA